MGRREIVLPIHHINILLYTMQKACQNKFILYRPLPYHFLIIEHRHLIRKKVTFSYLLNRKPAEPLLIVPILRQSSFYWDDCISVVNFNFLAKADLLIPNLFAAFLMLPASFTACLIISASYACTRIVNSPSSIF